MTLFESGQLFCTSGVGKLISPLSLMANLRRHLNGDWGTVDDQDWKINDHNRINGGRLISRYADSGIVFWVVTEADRSKTTFLLPSEY